MANPSSKTILIVVLVVLALVGGYYLMNQPDNRGGVERVGDAISELPNGPSEAAEQLEDQSPLEKAGDAIEDGANDVKQDIQN